MIVPLLLGLRDFALAPLTWTLIFLNLGFYFLTLDPGRAAHSEYFRDSRQLQRTGVYYFQYLNKKELPEAGELVLWGVKGLRDPGFARAAELFPFKGDAIEIKKWREDFQHFRQDNVKRATNNFGVSRDPAVALQKPLTWVTYQFMHASPMHLMSNLVFLLLFGIALERLVSSLSMLIVFLGGGIFGALFALITDEPSAIPMVGASAAVSALIAFYLFVEPRKNIRYFYFFSPFEGFYGEIFLSKWWILPLCLLPDVASLMSDQFVSSASLLGQSVATSAHVGGAIFGVVSAFFYVYLIGDVGFHPSSDTEPVQDGPQTL